MKRKFYPFRPDTQNRFDFERKVEARGESMPSSARNTALVIRVILTNIVLLIALPFLGRNATLPIVLVLFIGLWVVLDYAKNVRAWYPTLSSELKKDYIQIYWTHILLTYGVISGGFLLLAAMAFALQALTS